MLDVIKNPEIKPEQFVELRLKYLHSQSRERQIETESAKTSSAIVFLLTCALSANPVAMAGCIIAGTLYGLSLATDFYKTKKLYPVPLLRRELGEIIESIGSQESFNGTVGDTSYLSPSDAIEYQLLKHFPTSAINYLNSVDASQRLIAYQWLISAPERGQSFNELGILPENKVVRQVQQKQPQKQIQKNKPTQTPIQDPWKDTEIVKPTQQQTLKPTQQQTLKPTQTATPPINTPYTNEDKPLIDDWLDSLMLTRCIIAGQRTGKTFAASVASYHAKSQYGIKIYYFNFNDHGQGNVEAFDHADDIVCCNWSKLNETKRCEVLRKAIEILDVFAASPKQLLIVDEWMCLGARVANPDTEESTVLMDHFWRRMFEVLTSLNSTAAGSGKALWAICPYFKAGALRDEAKAIKNAKLLMLAIRPGLAIPWTDPNGIKLDVTYDALAVDDGFTNWRQRKDHPTTQEILKWEQLGEERVYWSGGKWQSVGVIPIKPRKISQQVAEKTLTISK